MQISEKKKKKRSLACQKGTTKKNDLATKPSWEKTLPKKTSEPNPKQSTLSSTETSNRFHPNGLGAADAKETAAASLVKKQLGRCVKQL